MAPSLSRLKARLSSRSDKNLRKTHEVETRDQSAEPIVRPGSSLSEALVTSTSASNVNSQSQVVESLSTGHTDEQTIFDVAVPALSPAQELWNRAYNAIREKETALVDSYERILSLEMRKDDSDRNLSQLPNLIPQNSETKRWSQMEQLVQIRLARLEKDDQVKRTTGTVVQATLSVKDAISLAVQSVPQAAVAWAGICFILQLSTNPVTESQSRRDGTAYVVAKMEWYQQLSDLLWQDDAAHPSPLAGLQAQLENQIVNLFEQIMLYLMKGVCTSFRHRFSVILCDMLKLDDWVGSLKGVENAECTVRQSYHDFDKQEIRLKLEQLVESARRRERALLHDQADQKCFQHLHVTDPRDDKTRIEQTKGGLLQDSYQWILDNADFREWRGSQQSRIFWIKGDPGKGKTMLLCGIIDEIKKAGAYNGLLSFFFCQATDDRINSATSVLRGLIFLIIDQQPSLISHVRRKYDHAGQSLFQDRNAWVALSEIFTNILRDKQLKDTCLIIDALDECTDDRSQLIDLLIRESSAPSRVKWIISSRNWPEIEERLDLAKTKTSLCLELNAQSVSDAVTRYIQIKVGNLADLKDYTLATREIVQKHLVSNADNTFLWVALACEHLMKVSKHGAIYSLKMFVPGLEAFYGSMVQHMRTSDGDDIDLLEQILGMVTLVYRPITISELKALIDLPEDMSEGFEPLQDMIGRCGSFLTIRAQTVYFVHQSAKDFLLQKCNPPIFSSGEAGMHYEIFLKALRIMSTALHRDIYGIRAPGIPIEQVQQPVLDPLDRTRYSCVYWVDHLVKWDICRPSTNERDDEYLNAIDAFLGTKYLYWLEALSLMKAMSEGVLAILQLQDFVQSQNPKSKTLELLKDAHRFILHNRWLIEHYPLQTYCSALIFSPTRSLIRREYERESPTWILTSPRVEDDWSACLLTLGGHTSRVTSIAFSPGSKLVASGSWDRTVRIWQVVTGHCVQTFEGTHTIDLITFSHDGKYLASGDDAGIDIWGLDSNKRLRTLELGYVPHSEPDRVAFAFSSDGKYLIVLRNRLSLGTWEVSSGKCMRRITDHPGLTSRAALSHDGRRFASTSGTAIKIWDTQRGRCLQTLDSEDSKPVSDCSFSPDGECLGVIHHSGHSGSQVKVWNIDMGKCLMDARPSEGLEGDVSIAISHDNLRLAISISDEDTTFWDIVSGDCLQRLGGGLSGKPSGQFSYNGNLFVTGSSDGTVSFWNVFDSQRLTGIEDLSKQREILSSSCDNMLAASLDFEENIGIWDTAAKKRLHTIKPHVRVQNAVFSSDGRLFAIGLHEGAVQIWNLLNGKCHRVLKGRETQADRLVFSPDGCYLASGLCTGEIEIWDVAQGDCLHLFQGYRRFRSICFSDDGILIAYHTKSDTVNVCNVISGEVLHAFRSSSRGHYINVIAFSHSGQLLAADSSKGGFAVWNLVNGKCLQTLANSSRGFFPLVFSTDDRFLASATPYGRIRVWNLIDRKCLYAFDIGWIEHAMSFDITSSHLSTSRGTFKLDLEAASAAAQTEGNVKEVERHGYGFDIKGHWIMHNSERLLWLPPDFRPTGHSAIRGSTVFLGRVNQWGPVTFEFVSSEDLPMHLGRETDRLDETDCDSSEESTEESLSTDSESLSGESLA